MNNNQPLISVIIPCFNVENYIEECLLSISNNTYKFLEIIAVDDGSSDHTKEIIEKLAVNDKRIHYIYQKNSGAATARNTGLSCCNGEFIAFIDSDDLVSRSYFEFLYNCLIKSNADFSCCQFNRFYDENININESFDFNNFKLMNRNEYVTEETYLKHILDNVTAKLFRKEMFNEIRFRDGKFVEDAFFFNDLMKLKISKISYSVNKMYYYRRHDDSMSKSRIKDRMHYDLIEARKDRVLIAHNQKEEKGFIQISIKELNGIIFGKEYEELNKEKLLKVINNYGKIRLKCDKTFKGKIKGLVILLFSKHFCKKIKIY